MRLTIVVPDKTIVVDGEGYSGISTDWSWVPEDIHAVQWYGSWGEIEYTDERNNEKIEELGPYSVAVTHHQNEKQRIIDQNAQWDYEWEWNRDWPRLLRKFRTMRLSDSDWSQVPDNSLTEEQREAWRAYRQELRDLPSNLTEAQYRELVRDFDHPLWPTEPS